MSHEAAFVPCGVDHVAVLGATGVAAIAAWIAHGRLRATSDQGLRRALAVVLAANALATWARLWSMGRAYVPLQLCDVALVVAVIALWTANRPFSEVAYFWGLGGSLQALVTPDLREPFPSAAWWSFFLGHGGVVASAAYLAVTGCVSPTGRSVWRMWGLTNGYALMAGVVNWVWGTNYGYLAQKPSQSSLLDLLGPWPVYIAGMELIALGSFALFWAPFAVAQRRGSWLTH